MVKLEKKLAAKGEKRLDEMKEIELDTYSGKITGAQARTKTLGLVCRSVDDLLAKDNFDIDIKIGDSNLRINILENLNALVDFLWDNTFGPLMPKKELKPVPVTDCTVYYRILP